jgi:hypothetical protein
MSGPVRPPERVDTVVCTHLHVDHVGWNARRDGERWVPTSPNARHPRRSVAVLEMGERKRARAVRLHRREASVECHADSGVLVLPAHFPRPGYIVRVSSRRHSPCTVAEGRFQNALPRRGIMKRSFAAILALGALVGLGTGCQTMTGRSFGTNVDDKMTTAAVKARLSANDLRHLTWVDVDTTSGIVYLTGTVASAAHKQQAEGLARTSKGVRQVVNHLQVRGEPATAAGPGTTDRQAQTSNATTSPAASPAATAPTGRQRLLGEVTKVDRDSGRVSVRTSDGDLTLQLPAATVSGLREGDRVTVEVAIAPVR